MLVCANWIFFLLLVLDLICFPFSKCFSYNYRKLVNWFKPYIFSPPFSLYPFPSLPEIPTYLHLCWVLISVESGGVPDCVFTAVYPLAGRCALSLFSLDIDIGQGCCHPRCSRTGGTIFKPDLPGLWVELVVPLRGSH